MPTEPIIEIKQLQTRLGAQLIHDPLNLEILRNEIIALIGSSGAGKSILLKEMILLEKPVAGSIRILGQEILHLDDKQSVWLRRHCGVMFQNGALFSSLTVAENIALPLSEHTQLSQRLIKEITQFKMALVGLPAHAAHQYPAQLSGGMIKRAAVARALALDPKILFLDEPTAGLDPIGAEALDELILRLKESLDLTIVVITHDLDSLWKITDRVAVLADKQIVAVAPIRELTQLNHPWLQAYFQGSRGRAVLSTL